MKHFETMIARYNTTLPTITNDDGQELQLTSRGVLYVTVADAAGVSAIAYDGNNVTGGIDRGFLVYGWDANKIEHPLKVNSLGQLEVALDTSPGTEGDVGTDEAGSETEPGVIGGITGSYVTIASVSVPNGVTYGLQAFDFTADSEAQFQLVVESTGAPIYLRTTLLPENQGTNQIVFPRPKEILAADASTFIRLKAKSLRGRSISASGGINGYYPA